MRRPPRTAGVGNPARIARVLALLLGVLALGAPPSLASSMNASDAAHLRFIRNAGSLLIEEGTATGTLPGNMKARCSIGAIVHASFTIYTRYGSIRGRGTATPRASGIYESFAGTLLATGGTGRYAHAHGHAGLYGVFNRKTYALTLQTTGRLSY